MQTLSCLVHLMHSPPSLALVLCQPALTALRNPNPHASRWRALRSLLRDALVAPGREQVVVAALDLHSDALVQVPDHVAVCVPDSPRSDRATWRASALVASPG